MNGEESVTYRASEAQPGGYGGSRRAGGLVRLKTTKYIAIQKKFVFLQIVYYYMGIFKKLFSRCKSTADIDSSMKYLIVGLGNVIVSSAGMNWWSARNWCLAQEKRLVNIEDLQAYTPQGALIKTAGQTGMVAACAQGKTCAAWTTEPYSLMWKGSEGEDAHTLTDAKDANGELYRLKFSPVVVSLAEHFKGSKNYIYLASDNGKSTKCEPIIVALNSGNTLVYNRNGSATPLCH